MYYSEIDTSLMNHSPPAPPGSPAFSSSTVPRLNLNTSVVVAQAYPSIQLLGLEMLLHYFLGPEVTTTAAKNKLTLSLGERKREGGGVATIEIEWLLP